MEDAIYSGVDGLKLRLVLLDKGVLHDPAGSDVMHITIQLPPDGTSYLVRDQDTDPAVVRSVTSEQDGERPCLEVELRQEDLLLPGTYKAQGYIENGAGRWPTRIIRFSVKPSILQL